MRSRSAMMMTYVIAVAEEEENTELFRHGLTPDGRRRRQRRITRRALQHTHMSAFAHLYGQGCDQSLITTCGLDHGAYRELLGLFAPLYYQYTPYSKDGNVKMIPAIPRGGRPRSLDAEKCLGLYLMWLRTSGAQTFLCMVFGISGSVCAMFLRFARRL